MEQVCKFMEKLNEGTLELEQKAEIEEDMRLNLQWHAARIEVQKDFENENRGKNLGNDYNKLKGEFMTDEKIRTKLNEKWKLLKRKWPVLDRFPQFAIRILKVCFGHQSCC